LGGPSDFSEAAEDAADLGLDDIAGQLAGLTPQGFAVWPDNMATVDAWLVVCTQWRVTAMANGQVLWLGLDYASAKVGLDCADTVLTAQQWANLRMMERVASAALNGNR
jgi:hypothetical protein